MGKTNISQGPEQIKGILFPKTTKSGATALQTPEKSHTGSQFFCLLKVRGCSIRSAKAGTRCLFKWEALQSNRSAGVCRPGFLPGPLCTDPPRHVFHSPAQKSASTVMRHQLFDNNMTQLIRTRLQNVCLWGPASSAMCLRRRSD